ncbi:uncharacterized protein F5147DRAFT_650976 [Suillus discolor]|uniref:Uncharacterized protein n=1 Tax=Suillus discolor TaxID=1912936 RepID=A0A9P7FC14_9AGAM|nr:uncharacterized protein F5147DRAFT_650976 [Suillus discolor]KAG2112345.1 hypothetical protein F5147DRAFT_650976 [Suillus discolor]
MHLSLMIQSMSITCTLSDQNGGIGCGINGRSGWYSCWQMHMYTIAHLAYNKSFEGRDLHIKCTYVDLTLNPGSHTAGLSHLYDIADAIGSMNINDTDKKVPHSGLFWTKLTQKATNLVWYCNKKDEDIVFANFSGDKYQAVYDKHLANLNRFHLYMKDLGILDAICKKINVTSQIHAKVDSINIANNDCLSDDKIKNAIEEFQNGSGENGRDQGDMSDVTGMTSKI